MHLILTTAFEQSYYHATLKKNVKFKGLCVDV